MKYTRMVIAEANSEAQAQEVVHILTDALASMAPQIEGLADYSILSEEDGRMLVLITTFRTRELCIKFHCSRQYRQLVVATQHLLVGDFVVKLFQVHETAPFEIPF